MLVGVEMMKSNSLSCKNVSYESNIAQPSTLTLGMRRASESSNSEVLQVKYASCLERMVQISSKERCIESIEAYP